MRIAIVLGVLEVGGTELQLCRLAADLLSLGHVVTVVVLGNPAPMSEYLALHNVPVITLGWHLRDREHELSTWAKLIQTCRLVRLVRILRTLEPDICYSALFWANLLAMPIAALARVPLRISGRRGLTSSLKWSWLTRHVYVLSQRFAHVVVANSQAVALDASQSEGRSLTKCRVIYNGVDIPDETSNVTEQPAIGMMIASLRSYKGHSDLIQALSMMENPPVVRFVGEGQERPALERLIADLDLKDVCQLEGERLNASSLFRSVQFAILASHTEGLPNTVLEAMAAGLPTIATSVGGVPELLENGVSGILVAPHAPKELAAAVTKMASDPELRARLGVAARERARSFSHGACLESHIRLFRELLIDRD